MVDVQRVLVVGGGAIGGLLAARLAAGREVEVLLGVRTPIPQLVVPVEPTGAARVSVVEAPDGLDPVEWVVVATKTYDAAGLVPWVTAPCARRARFVVAQNGVEQVERLHAIRCGVEAVPGIVTYGAERSRPGHVLETLPGVVRVPDEPAGRAFAALAAGTALHVEVVADLVTALWAKLVLNLVSNSLTTLADVPVREVAERRALRTVASALIAECCTVARAVGADLREAEVEAMVDGFGAMPGDLHSSMWQDRRAGRPFEHESISGAVVRYGERLGIDTPCARAVTARLGALSRAAEPFRP